MVFDPLSMDWAAEGGGSRLVNPGQLPPRNYGTAGPSGAIFTGPQQQETIDPRLPAPAGDPSPGGPPPIRPPAPPAPSGPNWTELMEQQRRAAEAARRRLEGEYATRRDELRSQYQLSETDEERAQLAFLMAELDSATQRADQAIVAGYANAVQNIQGLGGRAGTAADVETQTVQDLFLNAAQRYAGMVGDVQQQTGLQAGLAGTAFGPAEDFMGLLAADAAREAALTQRLGGIVSQEMTDAERRMAFQQASQQADLQRQAAASGAQTRADQQAAVAARIAQERRELANNIRQLQTTYATLGASFDQDYVASYGQQAGMAQSEALFLADLASREREAAANRAAQMRMLEAQWGREDAQRPAWQTPELAQALLRWDLLPEIMKTPENYNFIFGRFFGGGIPLPQAPSPSPGEDELPSELPPLVDIPGERVIPEDEWGPGYTLPPPRERTPLPPDAFFPPLP